jgi:hypothetical protein
MTPTPKPITAAEKYADDSDPLPGLQGGPRQVAYDAFLAGANWQLNVDAEALEYWRQCFNRERERKEIIIELAQSVVTRWYREPPVAEGGDFLADMYNLKQALAAYEEQG